MPCCKPPSAAIRLGSKGPPQRTACCASHRVSYSEEKPKPADRSSLTKVKKTRPKWEQSLDRMVIHPFNKKKLCFDVVVMISVVFTAFILPVK